MLEVLNLSHSQQRISAFWLEKWRIFFEMGSSCNVHTFFIFLHHFMSQEEPLHTTVHDISSKNHKKWRNLLISSSERGPPSNVKELCIGTVFFLFIQFSNSFLPKNFRADFKWASLIGLNEWIAPKNHAEKHKKLIFRRGAHFLTFFLVKNMSCPFY